MPTRKASRVLLCLLISSFVLCAAKKTKPWQTGQIVKIQKSSWVDRQGKSTTTQTQISNGSNGKATATTTEQEQNYELYVYYTDVTVIGEVYTFVLRDRTTTGGFNRKRGCRYIDGDDLKFYQDKDRVFIIDPDGKECWLDIIGQRRNASMNRN